MGGSLILTATTVPANAVVTWTSSDDTKAYVVNGTVTGEAEGSATITAKITVDGTDYTDTCTVTVTPVPSVELNKDATTITAGQSETLTATTVPAGETVTWSSSDETVATVADGVVTTLVAGTTTITAKITVDGEDYTDTCAVTVE